MLSIFHWVQGGMTALFSLIPIFHLVMGLMILSGKFPGGMNNARQPSADMPRFVGVMFIAFAAFFICAGEAFAALTLFSARSLSHRRNRTFSLIVAGLNCLLFPFGTVLGVFTFLVLCRPSVAALYLGAPGREA